MMMVLAAVIVLAIAGGLAAWQLTGQHSGAPAPLAGKSAGRATQPEPTGAVSPAGSASATVPASPPPSSAPPSTAPPSTAPPTASAASTVAIGPAVAGQASAARVAAFLLRYFTAINHRDYSAYVSLFDSQSQPEPTRSHFLNGYRSTTDSLATLVGLSPTSAGLAATVAFESHQKPALSATHTACTSWHITLYLESGRSPYLIGAAPPGYRASYRPCS
jgi:hypothetical protein